MLAVLTGPVRSGKSRLALSLARESGRAVVLAVSGLPDDEEMARRIERHRSGRGDDITVLEIEDPELWLRDVPDDVCLVVDCLGTLLARLMGDAVPEDAELADAGLERRLEEVLDRLVAWLIERPGDTVVVTNEVGWGVVPASPSGRLFRDVLGRATARLVAAADCAWLVVAGRAIDLGTLELEVAWPRT